jgi:adenylate kinase family enzyme
MHDRPTIGPRISIRGTTGSGKTTLGHTLGQRLGLPIVELDAIYWLPNWQAKPLDQFRADVQAALGACPRGWICVGNYSHVQDLVLSQADTVLWLRLPFRVSFWRLCKRTVARAWTQQPLWAGNPNRESWRQSFCSRNSILLYAITSRKMHVETTLRSLGATPHHASIIELRSARAVRRLLERLAQSKPTAPGT